MKGDRGWGGGDRRWRECERGQGGQRGQGMEGV